MIPAGCFSSNKKSCCLGRGKETPSCPVRHIDISSRGPQSTLPFAWHCCFSPSSGSQTENTSFLKACYSMLGFYHYLLLLFMLQRRVQYLPNRCDLGDTWTGGPYQKSFLSSSHLWFPNILWKSTLLGIKHSWLLRSNFHVFITSFHTMFTCSQCSTFIPRSVHDSSWTRTQRDRNVLSLISALNGNI